MGYLRGKVRFSTLLDLLDNVRMRLAILKVCFSELDETQLETDICDLEDRIEDIWKIVSESVFEDK
jgi:hypothetical protein